jgi:ATP/maltotriose-dependent transcriptional regulator MalT
LEASGLRQQADEAWLSALRLGEAGGYVRAYVEGGAARRTLLRRSLEHEEGGPLARRVAEACPGLLEEAEERLTPRQRDALGLVAAGLSNRRIAEEMRISETTVRTHLREVFARLAVRSRTHAVAEARRLGLLEGPKP